MMLFRTSSGAVLEREGAYFAIHRDWDDLVNDDSLTDSLGVFADRTKPDDAGARLAEEPLAPIGSQELWGAGVTYLRSREARMDEAQDAGGGDFYDRVYAAERPELFLKATPHRIVGPARAMHLRRDSRWIVPEPELTLVVTRTGKIIGYTVANDLSCRDLEGENPLYLPQAKTYDRCAAVGPGILVWDRKLPPDTSIRLVVRRAGRTIVDDSTTLTQLKRTPEELVEFLFRDNSHPNGCLLMTGTGIVPEDGFSLQPADVVEISIDGIGTLRNSME